MSSPRSFSSFSPKRYSSLGYESSIEKARRAIAENELSKYEEKRRLQEESDARQRRAKAELLMNARRKEEEERLTGEELGGKLLVVLKEQVAARIEAQMRDEIKADVEKSRGIWYDRFVDLEKAEISKKLKADLEPVVRVQLSMDLMTEVVEDLRTDLHDEVEAHLKEEASPRIEQEVRQELRDALHSEVVEELAQENLANVLYQLRDEHRDEVLESLKKELTPIVEADLRKTRRNGIEKDNDAIPTGAHYEADRGGAHGSEALGRSTSQEPDTTETKEKKSGDEGLAASGDEGMQSEAQRTNGVEYPILEQSEDMHINTLPTDTSLPRTINESDHVDPRRSPDDSLDTAACAFETAETSKDFRFDPNVHEIKFSSPAVSDSGRKRSRSLDEEAPNDQGTAAKRLKGSQNLIEEETAVQVRIPVKKVIFSTPQDDDELESAMKYEEDEMGPEEVSETGSIAETDIRIAKSEFIEEEDVKDAEADEEIMNGRIAEELEDGRRQQQRQDQRKGEDEEDLHDSASETSEDSSSDDLKREEYNDEMEEYDELEEEMDGYPPQPFKQHSGTQEGQQLTDEEISGEEDYDSDEEEDEDEEDEVEEPAPVPFSNTKEDPIELDD